MKNQYWPYLVPFVAFLILTYATSWIPHGTYILYPVKTLIVGALLYYYRQSYTELTVRFSWLAILDGILVFIIWVLPEGWYPQIVFPAVRRIYTGRPAIPVSTCRMRSIGGFVPLF